MVYEFEKHLQNSSVGTPFFFENDFPLEWHMTRNERYGFIAMLEKLRPSVAIEIGTFKGGSLQVLSKYCKKVYSIEPKASAKETLQDRFPNVKFVTGYSYNVLPEIFAEIDAEKNELEFDIEDKSTRPLNFLDLVEVTVYKNAGGVWYSNNFEVSKTVPAAICKSL